MKSPLVVDRSGWYENNNSGGGAVVWNYYPSGIPGAGSASAGNVTIYGGEEVDLITASRGREDLHNVDYRPFRYSELEIALLWVEEASW